MNRMSTGDIPPGLRKILHWKLVLVYLLFFLCLSIVLATAIGPVYVPPREIVILLGSKLGLCTPTSVPHEVIIFQIRLPRIFLSLLVGVALATAGTTLQGLFKNPMADPYIIGIASGASVGAALSIMVIPQVFSI